MVDHKRVYQEEGENYQRLVAREDYQGNLLPAIREICPFDGLDVVDLGSGTGRLAGLVGPTARRVFAFDGSVHMISVAAELLKAFLGDGWLAAAGDHRAIPLPPNSADLILSGWSFCYLAVWEEGDWRSALLEGLKEIKRVLRERGTVVIIETLGTGVERPQPPDKLEPYLQTLEKFGFSRTWIRTDYRFRDQKEAQELTRFFFGEEMLIHITDDPKPILPECTGLWWRSDIHL
jgi:SAM-dependent methyltransferase